MGGEPSPRLLFCAQARFLIASFWLLFTLGGCTFLTAGSGPVQGADARSQASSYVHSAGAIALTLGRSSADRMFDMASILASDEKPEEKSRRAAQVRLGLAEAARAAEADLAQISPPAGLEDAHAAMLVFFVALADENQDAARFFQTPTQEYKDLLAQAQERTHEAGRQYERRRAELLAKTGLELPVLGFPAQSAPDQPVPALLYRALLNEALFTVPEAMQPLARLQIVLSRLTGRESEAEVRSLYGAAAGDLGTSLARLRELRSSMVIAKVPSNFGILQGSAIRGLGCMDAALAYFMTSFQRIADGENVTDFRAATESMACHRSAWTAVEKELRRVSG